MRPDTFHPRARTLMKTLLVPALMVGFRASAPAAGALALQSPAPASVPAAASASGLPKPMNWTAEQDHKKKIGRAHV